jgi:hypothetical protein
LGKISEEKKAKIIEKGFQLEAEGKISLKKYYESTQEFSLFPLNGYSIKYESIRHNKIYIQLKQFKKLFFLESNLILFKFIF